VEGISKRYLRVIALGDARIFFGRILSGKWPSLSLWRHPASSPPQRAHLLCEQNFVFLFCIWVSRIKEKAKIGGLQKKKEKKRSQIEALTTTGSLRGGFLLFITPVTSGTPNS
jgi:hypothetical protein